MSVRSTNVYEEQSLGIYNDDEESEPQFPAGPSDGQRMTVWSTYLAQHIRRQLSFDMWWLGVALFLVCIIERHELNNANAYYFDIFAIVFELVSAYGTVGLSLGLPFANYSLSGNLSTLSKLVVIAVMILRFIILHIHFIPATIFTVVTAVVNLRLFTILLTEPPADSPVLTLSQTQALLVACSTKFGSENFTSILQQILPNLR